jgi:hypothetical protein
LPTNPTRININDNRVTVVTLLFYSPTTSRRSSGSMPTAAWRIKKKVVADLTVTTFVIYAHSATSATYFAYPIRK